jgi:hypothetical protein
MSALPPKRTFGEWSWKVRYQRWFFPGKIRFNGIWKKHETIKTFPMTVDPKED